MCFTITSNKIEWDTKLLVHIRGVYTVMLKVARLVRNVMSCSEKQLLSATLHALTDVSVASQCGSIANVCAESSALHQTLPLPVMNYTGSHDLFQWVT